jgi:hypothetical protein
VLHHRCATRRQFCSSCACARARETPSVFLQRFASLSIQFSLCCYFSFVVVVVFLILFIFGFLPPSPRRLVLNSHCSPLFFRDVGVTEERRRYGQGRQGTGLLLRYRQEDERYGSLLSIPFCAYVESLSLSLSLSHTHTHTHTQHKSAFCVFLLSLFMLLGWRNTLSLALCMFRVCSLGFFMLRSIAVFFLHTDGTLLFSLPLFLLIKI